MLKANINIQKKKNCISVKQADQINVKQPAQLTPG